MPTRMTIEAIDEWLVACEELIATAGPFEGDDRRFTKAKAIREIVGDAVYRVNNILEGRDW